MKPLIEKAGLNTKKTKLDFSLRFLDYSFKLKTIMTKIMTIFLFPKLYLVVGFQRSAQHPFGQKLGKMPNCEVECRASFWAVRREFTAAFFSY
jgi:hypothetical protein